MNELLWLLLLVVNFLFILLAFNRFGKVGLFIWIPITVILANIQVTKSINLFGIEATLGNITYATGFLATDMISEFYGKEDAKKAVKIGFLSLIAMTVIMQIAILFTPNANDFAHDSMTTIFGFMPRIALGSLAAYGFSQFHDVFAYQRLKNKYPNKLWIRNNVSTTISQIIDTLIFVIIAFAGVYPWDVLLIIGASTFVIKWIVALLDTPCIYMARKMYNNKVKNIENK